MVSPEVLIKLVNTYATSFYASSLWNFFSSETDKLFKTWNVTIRNIFKLDRKTHRYLVEPLSSTLHLQTALLARFVSFYRMLTNSPKLGVRYLTRIRREDKKYSVG